VLNDVIASRADGAEGTAAEELTKTIEKEMCGTINTLIHTTVQ
jgi:hypothetical protein